MKKAKIPPHNPRVPINSMEKAKIPSNTRINFLYIEEQNNNYTVTIQVHIIDSITVWHCDCDWPKFEFFFCILNENVWVFLDHFDVLISKTILKK